MYYIVEVSTREEGKALYICAATLDDAYKIWEALLNHQSVEKMNDPVIWGPNGERVSPPT